MENFLACGSKIFIINKKLFEHSEKSYRNFSLFTLHFSLAFRSIKSFCYRFILRKHAFILCLTMCFKSCVELFVREGEDLSGEQSGIDSSVNRNSSNGDASGHLYCGKKGFNAA